MGSRGFELARELDYLPGEAIWEVGSERGEGSTGYLALVAAHRGVEFFTSDVDLAALQRAAKIQGTKPIFRSGEETIERWEFWGDGRPIRFAWLDGHDWIYTDLAPYLYAEQAQAYRARGQRYANDASQESHLKIAKGLHPWVPSGGVVAFDDTWLVGHYKAADDEVPGKDQLVAQWSGKGGLAVSWLLMRGYEILRAAGPTRETHEGFVALRRG